MLHIRGHAILNREKLYFIKTRGYCYIAHMKVSRHSRFYKTASTLAAHEHWRRVQPELWDSGAPVQQMGIQETNEAAEEEGAASPFPKISFISFMRCD